MSPRRWGGADAGIDTGSMRDGPNGRPRRTYVTSQYRQALEELGAVFDRLDDAAVDRAVQTIAAARHVSVYAGGREGLQVRGFVMRLFHLGRSVSVVGDMTTPA